MGLATAEQYHFCAILSFSDTTAALEADAAGDGHVLAAAARHSEAEKGAR
jgi:hypothetical protein